MLRSSARAGPWTTTAPCLKVLTSHLKMAPYMTYSIPTHLETSLRTGSCAIPSTLWPDSPVVWGKVVIVAKATFPTEPQKGGGASVVEASPTVHGSSYNGLSLFQSWFT